VVHSYLLRFETLKAKGKLPSEVQCLRFNVLGSEVLFTFYLFTCHAVTLPALLDKYSSFQHGEAQSDED